MNHHVAVVVQPTRNPKNLAHLGGPRCWTQYAGPCRFGLSVSLNEDQQKKTMSLEDCVSCAEKAKKQDKP